jgi:hypothetical protein
MANQWLRLWHDMPNDPKWRTIAKVSGQPVPSVLAVYLHLLVNASNATERGRTHGIASEDLASALDVETDQVEQILAAMQGRVLDGDYLTGWKSRQPEREDGASERAKRWREAKKASQQTQTNANERERTQDKDKDTDKETSKEAPPATPPATTPSAKKGTRLPADWKPTDELLAWAKAERPDLNLNSTVETFVDYWLAKAGKDGSKLDWNRTFKVWVRGEKSRPVDPKQNVVRPISTKQAPETPEQKAERKRQEQAAFELHMRNFGVEA